MPKLGRNIRYRLSSDGKKLKLEINLEKKGEVSKSGKSVVLATAGRGHYFKDGDGEALEGVGLNLNLFRLKQRKPKGKKRKSRKQSSDSSD